MAGTGDRSLAGLLSALAEAPDLSTAASYFVMRLVTLARASRAGMLRLDTPEDGLSIVASFGFETEIGNISIPLTDQDHPIVQSVLSRRSIEGHGALLFESNGTKSPVPVVEPMRDWVVVPMPGEAEWSGSIAAGAIFLEGSLTERAMHDAAEIVVLASPIMAKLARLRWQSQEVERANKLKSDFLASMSHELRTPINALIGYSSLLLDGVLGEVNPQQRDAIARGRAAAEHLLELINDILDLTKIEAGKMPLRLEEVSLEQLIREAAQQVQAIARRKGLSLSTHVAGDCPCIQTDYAKVKQVLLNLLLNAVKFTNHGSVSVEARATPAGVRIDVIDSGIGIRAGDLQAIWEDFRQVDQSRTREFGGTGLGLSITRKLLDRLGGAVSVESIYGQGSTFSIYLPLRMTPAGLDIHATRV